MPMIIATFRQMNTGAMDLTGKPLLRRSTSAKIFEEHFDRIVSHDGEGYRAILRTPMREVLKTWETNQR